MKPVRLLRPAEQELIEAAAYYEKQVSGLGHAFLDKVEAALDDIAEHPDRWPLIAGPVRRRLVYRFPYGILYRTEPAEVLVLAIAHLHRRPLYWRSRG